METKRKVSISQLDEIWDRAKKEWGDPGLRHPPPDIRFESLRGLLNEIEELFGANKIESLGDVLVGDDVSVRKKKRPLKGRKIWANQDEDDEEEIPF